MDEQTKIMEALIKESEKILNQQEVQQFLEKMEERIKLKEDEIKIRKAHTFNRDKSDYEHGRSYTFARKYDASTMKEKINLGGDVSANLSNTDISSDPGSSADEAPSNKLDFRGEMRLMQMAVRQKQKQRSWRHKTRQGKRKRQQTQRSGMGLSPGINLRNINIIFYISKSILTINQVRILNLGLSFSPTVNWDYVNTCIELYKFIRKLLLIKHFAIKTPAPKLSTESGGVKLSGFTINETSDLAMINDLVDDNSI
ncbi:hypothetical protein NDU88_005397 [Pleurodeles waltl]|uniref:Uncharacterized protein n=1 Tax=Pleurodeles waltl TaxID=8319 RepID=A0AAV7WYF4_PLEWA|nr:hypothetical protein NDU88_005397 [Pleurodeles waltl]